MSNPQNQCKSVFSPIHLNHSVFSSIYIIVSSALYGLVGWPAKAISNSQWQDIAQFNGECIIPPKTVISLTHYNHTASWYLNYCSIHAKHLICISNEQVAHLVLRERVMDTIWCKYL